MVKDKEGETAEQEEDEEIVLDKQTKAKRNN